MSNLVFVGFDDIHTADEVPSCEYLIDLEEACVVERDSDGKAHLKACRESQANT